MICASLTVWIAVLVIGCELVSAELDQNLKEVLDKLYANGANFNPQKTFEQLKKAEKLLPPKVRASEDLETKEQLKVIPGLIKIATHNPESCKEAKSLNFYDFLLRKIDKQKWLEEQKTGAVKGFDKSKWSPAYSYVRYHQKKQVQLCQRELSRSIVEAIKDINFWDEWFLIGLKWNVKRSSSNAQNLLGQVTLACQSSVKRAKKDWKNKEELKQNPAIYDVFFKREIVDKCLIVNQKLGSIHELYESVMKKFIKKDKLAERWLTITEICSSIISNESDIRAKCLENELKDTKTKKVHASGETSSK